MAKVRTNTQLTHEITVTLNPHELGILRGLMQNPWYSVPPEDEDASYYELRKLLWDELNAIPLGEVVLND